NCRSRRWSHKVPRTPVAPRPPEARAPPFALALIERLPRKRGDRRASRPCLRERQDEGRGPTPLPAFALAGTTPASYIQFTECIGAPMPQIAIIGSGFAALTAVRALRRRGVAAEITVISPR